MGVFGSIGSSINDAKNYISNPPFLRKTLEPSLRSPDFPEGFLISEILYNKRIGKQLFLTGWSLPKIPFTFGGSQRIKKEFYAGYSEPAVHVLGPEEDDITIDGKFSDKRYKDISLRGVATELQQLVDSIRIRGNIVWIRLGDFERYGLILKSKFELTNLAEIKYSITFSIIGFNAPKNAVFLQQTKEVPFAINNALIDKANKFNSTATNIPSSVPQSIADRINSLTSAVASGIATVTGLVETALTTVRDIQNAAARIKGLISHTQNTIRNLKNTVGGFNPFDLDQSLSGQYGSAAYYSSLISGSSALTSLLEQLRQQVSSMASDIPVGRHLVVDGDTLQKISVKFYGTPDSWKKIFDYNKLTGTELVNGTLLEIPR